MSLRFENSKCVGILKTGKRKDEVCGASISYENNIFFCKRHIGQYHETVKNNNEDIEIIKSNRYEHNTLKSCILCLKGKNSDDIIYSFLESYSIYHKFDYNKLDLNNLHGDKDPIQNLINYIEDYIKVGIIKVSIIISQLRRISVTARIVGIVKAL